MLLSMFPFVELAIAGAETLSLPPDISISQTRAEIYIGQDAAMLKTDTRQANWRRANPGKYDAHLAVQRAVKAGELEKQPCEVCGVEAVDAHHDQYDEPLKVRWLCRRHHTRLHHYGEDTFPVGDRL